MTNFQQKTNSGLGRNFRLVYNGKCVIWCHLAEITKSMEDLTDMTDEEFEQFIRRKNNGVYHEA